jgi:hypothetical protein
MLRPTPWPKTSSATWTGDRCCWRSARRRSISCASSSAEIAREIAQFHHADLLRVEFREPIQDLINRQDLLGLIGPGSPLEYFFVQGDRDAAFDRARPRAWSTSTRRIKRLGQCGRESAAGSLVAAVGSAAAGALAAQLLWGLC